MNIKKLLSLVLSLLCVHSFTIHAAEDKFAQAQDIIAKIKNRELQNRSTVRFNGSNCTLVASHITQEDGLLHVHLRYDALLPELNVYIDEQKDGKCSIWSNVQLSSSFVPTAISATLTAILIYIKFKNS